MRVFLNGSQDFTECTCENYNYQPCFLKHIFNISASFAFSAFSSLERKLVLDFTHWLDLYRTILFLFSSHIKLSYSETAWSEPAL